MPAFRSGAYLFPILALGLGPNATLSTQTVPRFGLEAESGQFRQSRNDVQIPSDETGARFSLEEVVGGGAWAFVRSHLNWNLNDRHDLPAVRKPKATAPE